VKTFPLGARAVNRYDLYELCVQSPDAEARFIEAVHAGRAEHAPRVLAEDFAGPCSVARAWVAQDPHRRAICTDLDEEPLAHARARAAADLGPAAAARITFRAADVRDPRTREADAVAALNFAVCELLDRAQLLRYLRAVRARLHPGGVFVADLYAGPNAFMTGEKDRIIETDAGEITYTWEQREADPLTGRVTNAMHFTLPGGDSVRDAFLYRWRLWSVPELRDALREAGFASTEVHLSYGDAVDDEGRLYASPASDDRTPGETADDERLDDDFIALIVARA